MKYNVIDAKSIAKHLNDLTYTDYFYRLMLLAKSVFKWNNLPNGIDEKWIEKFLFSEGQCMFYKDEEKGFMVARCTIDELNYYDEPIRLRAYGTNLTMAEAKMNNVDCVLIRNNDECIPTSPTIQLYAWRLAEIARTIDTNIDAMKMPYFIRCSDKQRLSLKNAMNQRKANETVIWADKSIDLDGFEVLKTDVPVVFDKLQIQKHAVWNEVMTFLGINNANMDKRERLVDDEVQANNEQVGLSSEVMLKSRQKACELINNMFELNISVELRKQENVIFKEIEYDNEKEELECDHKKEKLECGHKKEGEKDGLCTS